jgi:hypothetical protein
MKIAISKFDMTRLRNKSVILLIGRRGSGKSWLLKWVNYYLRKKVDYAIGFAGSLSAAKDIKGGGICESQIFMDFDITLLEGIVDQCKYWVEAKIERQVLIVMDDMMFDKKLMKHKVFREIFMNGRHYNITFVCCMQYCMDMAADLRSQVDYVFSFHDSNEGTREKLRREFFGVFPNLRAFNKVTEKCISKQFECLVLDVKGVEGKQVSASDTVFWYKAPEDEPHFRIGRSTIWRLHRRYQITHEEKLRRAKAAADKNAAIGKLKKTKTKAGVIEAPAVTQTPVVAAPRKNEPPDIEKVDRIARSRSITLNVGNADHKKSSGPAATRRHNAAAKITGGLAKKGTGGLRLKPIMAPVSFLPMNSKPSRL